MDGHGSASGSLPRATGFMPRVALQPRTVLLRARVLQTWLLLCLVRPQLCLEWLRALVGGAGGGDVANVDADGRETTSR
jgi:hypothetical protein